MESYISWSLRLTHPDSWLCVWRDRKAVIKMWVKLPCANYRVKTYKDQVQEHYFPTTDCSYCHPRCSSFTMPNMFHHTDRWRTSQEINKCHTSPDREFALSVICWGPVSNACLPTRITEMYSINRVLFLDVIGCSEYTRTFNFWARAEFFCFLFEKDAEVKTTLSS